MDESSLRRRRSMDNQPLLPGMRSLTATNPDSVGDLYMEGGDSKREIQTRIEAIIHEAADREPLLDKGDLLKEVLDISSPLTDAASAIIDDSFLRCFTSMPPDNWNWNFYLFPLWCMGVVVRYCILFPLRFLLLIFSLIVLFLLFFTLFATLPDSPRRRKMMMSLVRFQANMFVASWTGVVKFHGPPPVPGSGRIWVANHTSMIDYCVLSSYTPFAAIAQIHKGWVGFMQNTILGCLGCIWFNRTEVKDRKIVSERMRRHVQDPESNPLLVFPEGTCVNNEYCVMFKRGAFDLGATVCPIAIKYNKSFVDAFWNSKRQSFTAHLLKLMTSWAVVCDVYFLEPQTKRSNENSIEFAARVQELIAKQAQLVIVPWDGYLKYYNLGQKNPHLIEKRKQVFASSIRKYLANLETTPEETKETSD